MASNGRSQQVKSLKYSRKVNRDNAVERRRQFTPRKRASESEDDGVCDLCVQKIKIYAIGYCDHPICYRCSAKMRVLCDQLDCAVCRVNMKKIIYSKSRRIFNEANSMHLIHHTKNNVWFTDDVVKVEYEKLFEHRCSVCTINHWETSFEKLEAHMRKDHKLFYCNLCVRFNTNFTDECKTYTRELLAKHRRIGDDDDSSHKGHPLCEFCDERYLDKDVLLQHLRKDHYFCHFCDKDGKNQYYDGYVDLRQHYRQDHFLCEEGDCINEQFTSVFATKLDLQAHRTAAHMGNLSKQQQKVERNIDLGFQYPKPSRGGRGRRDNNFVGSATERNGGQANANRDEDLELAKAISLSEHEKKKGEPKKKVDSRPRVQREQPKQQPQREPTPPPDLVADFPTLGTSGNDQQRDDPYHYSSVRKTAQTTEEKADTNYQYGPTAADRLAAAAGRSVGKITQEDFPSLGLSETNKPPSSSLWAQPKNSTSKARNTVAKSINRSVPPVTSNSGLNLHNQGDFPNLGGRPPPIITQPPPSQPKKAISVNMPQTKFSKANVNLKNNEEFPSLGGKSAAPTQGNIWGPGISAEVVSKKKTKKAKTPLTSQEAPRPKQHSSPAKLPPKKSDPVPQMSSSLHSEYDPLNHNDSVAVRIGSHKHTVRLTSTDYSAALEGVEKPIEVPGVGGNSVRTVTAEAFSMLSKSSGTPWQQQQAGQSKFNAHNSDFPGLPSAAAGRIKGIGNSFGSRSHETETKPSLSNISKDIITKSKAYDSSDASKYDSNLASDIIKAPALSSYVADWYEEQQPSTSTVDKIKEFSFQAVDGDFPSLAVDGDFPSLAVDAKKNQPSSKKNKKKKKKGATINDVSKHFGTDSIEQNTGRLENLLKSQTIQDGASISDILDKGRMFSPNEEQSSSNITLKNNDNRIGADVTQSSDLASGIILLPRPHHDNVEGRNVWLINTVEQLCGTSENFVEFKMSSGQFRQGSLSAESYYEKCRTLLGKQHFELVFMELVDLLPDIEKKEELLSAHRQE